MMRQRRKSRYSRAQTPDEMACSCREQVHGEREARRFRSLLTEGRTGVASGCGLGDCSQVDVRHAMLLRVGVPCGIVAPGLGKVRHGWVLLLEECSEPLNALSVARGVALVVPEVDAVLASVRAPVILPRNVLSAKLAAVRLVVEAVPVELLDLDEASVRVIPGAGRAAVGLVTPAAGLVLLAGLGLRFDVLARTLAGQVVPQRSVASPAVVVSSARDLAADNVAVLVEDPLLAVVAAQGVKRRKGPEEALAGLEACTGVVHGDLQSQHPGDAEVPGAALDDNLVVQVPYHAGDRGQVVVGPSEVLLIL